MTYHPRESANRIRLVSLNACLCASVLIAVVSGYGYSEDYEGYLGETIALNGESYNSDQIYLFMTGPGLPENGVTLTDMSRRADQGYFTAVGVDSSQKWLYKWDTSRLENEIDPGTYMVYVVNAPADKSSLTGHSYQTLSVYLKDGMLSKNRVSIGTKYTLNLADDEPVITTTTVTTAPPATTPATIVPDTTMPPVASIPSPTKKSSILPVIAIPALIAGYICILRRNNA